MANPDDTSAPADDAGSARAQKSKTGMASTTTIKSEKSLPQTKSVLKTKHHNKADNADEDTFAATKPTKSKKKLKTNASTTSAKPSTTNTTDENAETTETTRRLMQTKTLPPFPAYHSIIKALPRPTLPMLKTLPYYSKLPVVCNARKIWRLSTTPLGFSYNPRVPQADFDLSDPYLNETDITYRPLNDVHLREYLNKPMIREQLKFFDLATEDDRVRCNAKEFNDWRKLMYKTWLRAVNEIRREVHLFEQVHRMQETAKLVQQRVGLLDTNNNAEKPDFIDSEWIPIDMRKDIFSRNNNAIARVSAEKARDEARQEVLDQYIIAKSFEKELHHVQRYLKKITGAQSDRKKHQARMKIVNVKRHEHTRRVYAMGCEKKAKKRQEMKDWWTRHSLFQTQQAAANRAVVQEQRSKPEGPPPPASQKPSSTAAPPRQNKRSVAYQDDVNLLSEPPKSAAASRKQSVVAAEPPHEEENNKTDESAATKRRRQRAASKVTTFRRQRKSKHSALYENVLLNGPTGRPTNRPSYTAQIKTLYNENPTA